MGKANKVVVVGMKGVGKTTLLEQLIYGNFENQVNTLTYLNKNVFGLPNGGDRLGVTTII